MLFDLVQFQTIEYEMYLNNRQYRGVEYLGFLIVIFPAGWMHFLHLHHRCSPIETAEINVIIHAKVELCCLILFLGTLPTSYSCNATDCKSSRDVAIRARQQPKLIIFSWPLKFYPDHNLKCNKWESFRSVRMYHILRCSWKFIRRHWKGCCTVRYDGLNVLPTDFIRTLTIGFLSNSGSEVLNSSGG